jgi:putative intracellular protease/amidase
MVALLNGPRLREHVDMIASLLDKAEGGALTDADRRHYFSTMPMIGLWDAPRRVSPDGANLDAVERKILLRLSHQKDLDLDEALRTIEAKLPPPARRASDPSRSIAVMVSSAGAQWQELMDWALVMHQAGYHLQIFTADGRPAAFQADSLSVNVRTSRVGHGAPRRLDPMGEAGALAKELLAETASAATFVEADFGAKFSAGGLGFNEDIAVAIDAGGRTQIALHPNVARMNELMVAARKPMISICHGPTELAATMMTIDGRSEPVNRGVKTASLPPFEAYVGLTGRKEVQFIYDVNTHQVLKQAGGRTNVKLDALNLRRTKWAIKDGLDIITGAGPSSARTLAKRTIEAMEERYGSS